jgi:iron complex transport system permease protein
MGLTLIAIFSVLISISIGSVHFDFSQLLEALFDDRSTIRHQIIFELRLSRTLCAFITGGLLALSGALMQALLRNPLADPYVLGTSGGAAVATLVAMLLGLSTGYLHIFAFMGSLCAMALVISLTKIRSFESSTHLLLTGIIVATGWGAIISLIFTVTSHQNLPSMLFWLIGDLSYAKFSIWQILVLVFALLISITLFRPLNIMYRGNLAAQMLGVNTRRMNLFLYVLSSFFTACAVSIAGCISFVGLIVPHMLRLLGKSDHRFILPGSILLGGSLLTLADAVARSIIAPMQLPDGVVTAIIGVPLFLFLLRYHR